MNNYASLSINISNETLDQFKVRSVPTYKCHNCGCAHDSIEEATCCPCYDELEEYYK